MATPETVEESTAPFPSLNCVICCKPLTDPKLLDCAHTFCLPCLSEMLRDITIMCPLCRKHTTVPGGNVTNLKDNYAIISVMEDARSLKTKCGKCDTVTTRDNLSYCPECCVLLCQRCLDNHAGTDKHKAHANKMKAMSEAKSRPPSCFKHSDELGVSVCLMCSVPLCKKCQEFHKTKRHNIKSCPTYIYELFADTIKIQEDYKKLTEICKKNVQNGIENEKITVKLAEKLKYEVNREHQRVVEELDERKASLVNFCDSLTDEAIVLSNKIGKELIRCLSIAQSVRTSADNIMQSPFLNISEYESRFKKHSEKANKLKELSQSRLNMSNAIRKKAEDSCFVKGKKNRIDLGTIEINSWEKSDIALSSEEMTDAAVKPNGTIAVGYFKGGIELIRPTGSEGSILMHVKVLSLAWFLDDDLVIRDIDNDLSIYKNLKKSSVKFSTLGHGEGGEGVVVVNSENKILMSYREVCQIHIFAKQGGKAIIVIKCNGFVPQQISPGLDSDIVVMDAALIKVIDHQGNIKSELQQPGHFGYPAVMSDGSVLVAWVKEEEEVVQIVQYTRELKRRRKIVATLLGTSITPLRKWYKLQAISTDKMFLCSPNTLHFFLHYMTPFQEEYSTYL